MVNRWYPVGCCKPKAFELGRGRQPGDPGGFEPPLPVWRKPGEKKGCATDNDATDPVPIRKCPDPPGDEPGRKPGGGEVAVPTDNDAETPAARAHIRNNNE